MARRGPQVEGGLHDATLDKSPGSGAQWAARWNGFNLQRLARKDREGAAGEWWGYPEKLTVFEHNNPVPAWAVYGTEYYDATAVGNVDAQRQPHPTQRTRALLEAMRQAALAGES